MKMTAPLLNQLASMYIVFYIFAQLGMSGLSGVVKQPNFHSEDSIPNNLYYLLNFNDLVNSLSVLYTYMIICNSPPSTDMYVAALGEARWPRVYFFTFYVIINWIVLNIIVAMILDVFATVEEELDRECNMVDKAKKLMALQQSMGKKEFAQLCKQVNFKLLEEDVARLELSRKAIQECKNIVSQHLPSLIWCFRRRRLASI